MTRRLGSTLAAAAAFLVVAGCNSDRLQTFPKPVESPTPTPGPGDDLAPVAVIAGESVVAPGDLAAFDGSGSSDPDGTITGYSWSLLSRPSGSAAVVTTSSGNAAHASVNADVAGDYTIQLSVTDDAGLTGSADVTFGAVPTSGSLRVELKWPTQYGKIDLDDHLVDVTEGSSCINGTNNCFLTASTTATSEYDCFFGTCTADSQAQYGFPPPEWFGATSTGDDPHLDGDNVAGAVPENITIAAPHDGTYRVGVHFYAQAPGAAITPAFTVTVYASGVAKCTTTTLPALTKKDLWEVWDVAWTAGNVTCTPVNRVVNIH